MKKVLKKKGFTLIELLVACHPKLWLTERRKAILPAFTLIELLVVISVIGILAAFAIASFSSAQARGRDAKRKGDLDAISKSLQLYYNDNQDYPINTVNPGLENVCWSHWGCWEILIPTSYIKNVPVDPKNVASGDCYTGQACYLYHYCRLSDSQYVIITNLENANDPQKKSNNGGCDQGGANPYWVTNP